jgi:hypothetical protein
MLKDEFVKLLLFSAEADKVMCVRVFLCVCLLLRAESDSNARSEEEELIERSFFVVDAEPFLCNRGEMFPESIMSTKLKSMKNCFLENMLMNFIMICNYINYHFGIK